MHRALDRAHDPAARRERARGGSLRLSRSLRLGRSPGLLLPLRFGQPGQRLGVLLGGPQFVELAGQLGVAGGELGRQRRIEGGEARGLGRLGVEALGQRHHELALSAHGVVEVGQGGLGLGARRLGLLAGLLLRRSLLLERAAGGGELRQHVGAGVGLQVEHAVLDGGLAGVGRGEHLEGILCRGAHEGVDHHLVAAHDQVLDPELALVDRSIGVGQRVDGPGQGPLGGADLRDVVGHRGLEFFEPAGQRRGVVGGHEHLGPNQRLLSRRVAIRWRLLADTGRGGAGSRG